MRKSFIRKTMNYDSIIDFEYIFHENSRNKIYGGRVVILQYISTIEKAKQQQIFVQNKAKSLLPCDYKMMDD